tara:strand:+ start:1226 stop:2056 length:831 start_codon:yes stop_codon:yes gene_type:complete
LTKVYYEHINTISNPEGEVLAWIANINGSYKDFVKIAKDNGYQIFHKDLNASETREKVDNVSSELKIIEDVESITSAFELLLKIAIRNLDRKNYLRSLRISVIPTLERDIINEEILSSMSLNQLETFYTGFFETLMDEKDFNVYHYTYDQYLKLTSSMRNIPLNKQDKTKILESSIVELKQRLQEMIQFYNLLQVACLPIVLYIEIVKSYFEVLIKENFESMLDTSYFESEKRYVLQNHFPSFQIQIPNFNLYRFSSPFTSEVNLLNLIALDQIVK